MTEPEMAAWLQEHCGLSWAQAQQLDFPAPDLMTDAGPTWSGEAFRLWLDSWLTFERWRAACVSAQITTREALLSAARSLKG